MVISANYKELGGWSPGMIECVEEPIEAFSISGKLIEHWDEFNLLEVFQQIAAATVRKAEGQ